MATITTYNNGEVIANRNGMNNAGFPSTGVLVAEYDAASGGAAAGDSVVIANVPAGTIINSVVLETLTTDTASVQVTAGGAEVVATSVPAAGLLLGAGAGVGTLVSTAGTLELVMTIADADTYKCKVYVDMTVVG